MKGMSEQVRREKETPAAEQKFLKKEEDNPRELIEERQEIRAKLRSSLEDGTINKKDGKLGEAAWDFIELVRQKTGKHYTSVPLDELDRIRKEAKIVYDLIVLIEAAEYLEEKESRQ